MKRLSLEHRRKISETLKGKKKPLRTEEHAQNLSKAFKGRIPWNKGKTGVYSSETKKKISLTLKKRGIRPPSRKGIKLSDAHRTILKNVWVDRRRSNQNRLNSSLGARRRVLSGNHNFYRGGLVTIKQQIRDSVQYCLWREKIFERDNYICVDCDQRGGNLEADHIKSLAFIVRVFGVKTFEQALKCSILWDIDNGATRCKRCHEKTKNYGINEYRRLEAILLNYQY